MSVLPLDYPNRPTPTEAAREDRDHPLTGQSRFTTGPYRCPDPWCPRARTGEHWHGQDRGSAKTATTLAAAIALGLWLLVSGWVLSAHDQHCHASATTAAGHDLCRELMR